MSISGNAKLGVMIEPTNRKNWLTYGGDPVADADSGSVFHFRHRCGMDDFKRYSSSSHRPIFTTLGETTDADKSTTS